MITKKRIRVGIACSSDVFDLYFALDDLEELRIFADVEWAEFDVGGDRWTIPPGNKMAERKLCDFASDLDAMILCHGAPRVTKAVFGAAPNLKLVGDIEGDRFAGRVDVSAATKVGALVVDTSHASSWPVSEWALALMLMGLRRHGQYRAIIEGQDMSDREYRQNPPGRELARKTVGLIGFGHIAWHLCELLTPFETPVVAYDPYVPRELADAMNIDFASLNRAMVNDIVVCLAPCTPRTIGMIGREQLELLKHDAVFVNVSRGAVVDTKALTERAERGDIWCGLDVHDPEPIPVDSPLRNLSNVFLSPHIGGLTTEAQPRFFGLMVEELRRWVDGIEPHAQLTDRVLNGRMA